MLQKVELLAPAGSEESIAAAVSAGADAVYFGTGFQNARMGADSLDEEQLKKVVRFCRLHGVKTYATVNTLIKDREFPSLVSAVQRINDAGVDAVIVQDFGAAALIQKIAPQLCLHGSTQMSIYNNDGAKKAKQLGFSRIVLARELPKEDIAYISANSGMETEIFIHGALCMSFSGQCYFSSLIGQRSGNRGRCAQPCRLPYKNGYELSLKDLCLANKITDILTLGVTCLKIEGRLKSCEYVYGVTQIYRKLLGEKRNATSDEMEKLKELFSRSGFTSGYFDKKTGKQMMGIRTAKDKKDTFFNKKTLNFQEKIKKIFVDMEINIKETETIFCVFYDNLRVEIRSEGAQRAQNRSITSDEVEKQLRKTGATFFEVQRVSVLMSEGFMMPLAQLNNMRREGLKALEDKLTQVHKRPFFACHDRVESLEPKGVFGNIDESLEKKKGRALSTDALKPNSFYKTQEMRIASKMECKEPQQHVIISNRRQAEGLKNHTIHCLWMPLEMQEKIVENQGVVLPRVAFDCQMGQITQMLKKSREMGIMRALCPNLGYVDLLKELGFEIFGDFGMNSYNSMSIRQAMSLGFRGIHLSMEMSISQIRDVAKPISTGVTVYGHLPLMITENCIVKNANRCDKNKKEYFLWDRKNERFPVFCEFGHRSEILNSKPIYMADRMKDLNGLGLGFFVYRFTVESASQIDTILRGYQAGEGCEKEFTRGLFYKNIE